MSMACKCDRCGKMFVPDTHGYTIPAIDIVFRDVWRNRAKDCRTIELCYECHDALAMWLNGGIFDGREVRNTDATKGAGRKRREARKTDSGDTPDSE